MREGSEVLAFVLCVSRVSSFKHELHPNVGVCAGTATELADTTACVSRVSLFGTRANLLYTYPGTAGGLVQRL